MILRPWHGKDVDPIRAVVLLRHVVDGFDRDASLAVGVDALLDIQVLFLEVHSCLIPVASFSRRIVVTEQRVLEFHHLLVLQLDKVLTSSWTLEDRVDSHALRMLLHLPLLLIGHFGLSFDSNPVGNGHPLVVLHGQSVSAGESLLLNQGLFMVFLRLLFIDAFQKVVTRPPVHIKHSGRHDVLDHLLRHVVQQVPVGIVHVRVLDGSTAVLLDVSLLLSVGQLIIQNRVL